MLHFHVSWLPEGECMLSCIWGEWLITNEDRERSPGTLFSPSMQLFHIGERNLRCAELGSGEEIHADRYNCQIQCIQHYQNFCQSWCYFLKNSFFFFPIPFPTWAVLSLYSCMILPHSGLSLSWLSLLLCYMPLQVIVLILRHWVTLHWTSRSESTRAC